MCNNNSTQLSMSNFLESPPNINNVTLDNVNNVTLDNLISQDNDCINNNVITQDNDVGVYPTLNIPMHNHNPSTLSDNQSTLTSSQVPEDSIATFTHEYTYERNYFTKPHIPRKFKYDDFQFDDDNKLILFNKFDINKFKVKMIRDICIIIGFKDYPGLNKYPLIDALGEYIRKRNDFSMEDALERENSICKKNVNDDCRVRLINIVFSDKFREEYLKTGRAADRLSLDSGYGVNNIGFWEKIHFEFTTNDDPEYAYVQFYNDRFISSKDASINPSNMYPYDCKTLKDEFANIISLYKRACGRQDISGNYGQRFYEFCSEKIVTYYFFLFTERYYDLSVFVTGKIPTHACINTLMNTNELKKLLIILLPEKVLTKEQRITHLHHHQKNQNPQVEQMNI